MTTPTIRNTIVVGVDESDTALEAARWAADIAERLGAPLLLACSVPDPGGNYYYGGQAMLIYPDFTDDLRKNAQVTLERVRDKIAAAHPDLSLDTMLCTGVADIALVQLSEQARLTVVGAHVDADTGKTLIGPIALRVADHAHGPVAVWRGDSARPARADAPVVVGVDGTPGSAGAIKLAFELASALNVPLTAVHTWVEGTEDQATRTLAECLSGYGEDFPDVQVREIVQDGPAALALQQWSEYAQALVVASRVRNSVLATLLGSTSQNLLHHATVPLVIDRH
jgi:nucleotide-binding universal stress UspA family protein